VQNGFHSMEKIVVEHDDHGIVIVSIGAKDIVR
jgi:hypothetical protein